MSTESKLWVAIHGGRVVLVVEVAQRYAAAMEHQLACRMERRVPNYHSSRLLKNWRHILYTML